MSSLKRLRLPQVIEKTGWQRATIYKKIKEGEFIPPKKDGRISYWLEQDIDNWILTRA
ncbi:hypothetical protein [Moraxella phage Mcat2]|nr:hypothetical protein [Moraxella phage Mcat1]AKI27069.1 hypothetical protein [Moraxella phage Mcat2]